MPFCEFSDTQAPNDNPFPFHIIASPIKVQAGRRRAGTPNRYDIHLWANGGRTGQKRPLKALKATQHLAL
ncbi:hypothetical protein F4167_20825 [Candidatus Poribacteria bacterium]|nr:hypothetical protein [Candidatus Poribacteria bacterium]